MTDVPKRHRTQPTFIWKRVKPYAIIAISILLINGLYQYKDILFASISNLASLKKTVDQEAAKETEERYEVLVQTEGANIRRAPSLSADIVTAVPKGESLVVLQETFDKEGRQWLHVELKSGKEGWVSGKIVAAPAEIE